MEVQVGDAVAEMQAFIHLPAICNHCSRDSRTVRVNRQSNKQIELPATEQLVWPARPSQQAPRGEKGKCLPLAPSAFTRNGLAGQTTETIGFVRVAF